MLRALFVASFATISGAGVTSADEVDAITVSSVDIAQAYLDAYASYDMSLLDPFLADNAEFQDDTSSDQSASGGPFNFVGCPFSNG